MDCSSRQLRSVPTQLNKDFIFINLNENVIEIIQQSDFAGLTQLLTLSLSSNRISKIEEGSFSDLLQLRDLSLDNNRLTLLTTEHFVGLSNLQVLQLHGNVKLTIDPCFLSQMSSLTALSLQNTRIDFSDAFVIAKSTCLLQYPTAFTESSSTFPYVLNVRTLSLGYQGTSSDLTSLEHFRQLQSLALFNIPTTSFQNTCLSNLRHLKIVTLVGIKEYPVGFLKSVSITALSVSESTFFCLPKHAFLHLPSLTQLIIIRNSLMMIDQEAFTGARNLTFVNLAFNKLVSLPRGVFDDLGNETYFPQINLHSNQWHCDCKIKWMQDFPPFAGSLLFCQTPVNVAGFSIFSVNLDCDLRNVTIQSETDHCMSLMDSTMMTSNPRTTFSKAMLSSTKTTSSVLIPALTGGLGFMVSLLTLSFILVFCSKWKRNRQLDSEPIYATPTEPVELGHVTHTYLYKRDKTSIDNEKGDQLESGYATSIHDDNIEKSNMYEKSIAAKADPQQTYEKSLPSTYMEAL
ncbi:Leucine-rich repeat-containing protein 4 [Holothuria leucospilota]|uniref:Leucine-rich repeat-containing protein 4 n=1 Tax=Holothuria leucospilota TaxID=206669 RepID=A0A9Q1CM12_HOLLE|nr:Leucine-rich repeat-containing protein 4 [Holothuria leucospilota]